MNAIFRLAEQMKRRHEERTSFLNYVPNNYMPLTVRTWRMLMCLQASAPEPYENIQDRVTVVA